MILQNATIITMDEALPRCSALAIAGGKVIGGVDSREDAIASHAHERINLRGMTVVPGFVDAHVHFRGWAAARVRPDISDAGLDLDDALALLQRHAATLAAPTDWVLAHGWPEGLLPPGADVGAALEAAVDGHPAAVVSRDGHALWTTPSALALLGLAPDDLELPGGVVERGADGAFTGVLREESAWAARRRLPEDDISMRTLAGAMREANRRGVTTVHDMDGAAGFRSWRSLEQERGLTVRVWQHFLADDLPHLEALGITTGYGSERLRVGGIKVFADGTLGSGTALLHEPESGHAPRTGVAITDRDSLERLARDAAHAGLPLLVHTIGDAACTTVLDALEATADHWSVLPARPRLEHAQLMRPEDIARAAALGVVLSVQPTHLVTDRDVADARWAGRTQHAFALRAMLETGAHVILGSDAPIEDLHPLAALHAAVHRDGGAHGLAPARGVPWHPEQALTADEALRATTSWAADALPPAPGAPGRLSPGSAADIVVLSGNPLEQPFADIDVVATMVGGRWVHGAASLG